MLATLGKDSPTGSAPDGKFADVSINEGFFNGRIAAGQEGPVQFGFSGHVQKGQGAV